MGPEFPSVVMQGLQESLQLNTMPVYLPLCDVPGLSVGAEYAMPTDGAPEDVESYMYGPVKGLQQTPRSRLHSNC